MEVEKPTGAETQEITAQVEKETPEHPAQVESAGSATEEQHEESGRKPGPDPYYAQKRVTAKLQKEIDELREWKNQFQRGVTQTPEVPQAPSASQTSSDFWTNPEGTVDQKIKAAIQMDRLEKDKEESEEYILSQDYINAEEDKPYLEKLTKEYGLDRMANTPGLTWKAAELLLKIIKAEKGITEKPTASRAQVRSVQGGPAVTSGPKIYTRQGIADMSLEEFIKHADDIRLAYKEKRVKD